MKLYTVKMVITILLFCFNFQAQAIESKDEFVNDIWKLEALFYTHCSKTDLGNTMSYVSIPLQQESSARKGCCSHHSGVCGCSEGRAKCCDGTFSPSCGCD